MNPVTIQYQPFQGTSTFSVYLNIGASIFFGASAFVSFFVNAVVNDDFDHFDQQPKWMFMAFGSGALSMFTIACVSAFSIRFNQLASRDAEPGHEFVRYRQLRTVFALRAVVGFALAVPTAVLALLWGNASRISSAFMAPYICGLIAVVVSVGAIIDDGSRFTRERQAFLRTTGSDSELGNGEITI